MENAVINKADIIERLATKGMLAEPQAHDYVNIMLAQMVDTLSNGDRVEIRGFGSFALREYKPRKARNPKTGEAVIVDIRHFPHFKPGKELRKKVDESVKK